MYMENGTRNNRTEAIILFRMVSAGSVNFIIKQIQSLVKFLKTPGYHMKNPPHRDRKKSRKGKPNGKSRSKCIRSVTINFVKPEKTGSQKFYQPKYT